MKSAKNKKKYSIMICALAILLIIGIAVILAGVHSKTPKKKAQVMNAVCDYIYEKNAGQSRLKLETEDSRKISKELEKIGSYTALDDAFAGAFIEKNGIEKFFQLIVLLQEYYDYSMLSEYGHYKDSDASCPCQTVNNLLQYAMDHSDLKFVSFDSSQKDKKGWYGEHPNAHPLPEEADVQDKEHTTTFTITYYGDFAVMQEDGWSWDKGFLGWDNGKFIDRDADWVKRYVYQVYYKGAMIDSDPAVFSPEYVQDIKVYPEGIAGKIYMIQKYSVSAYQVHHDFWYLWTPNQYLG
ncbi:MAG: hypothetical protein IJ766_01330 [Clostridia bacterium]|nr:hypothetical protein [Clostridia bacterium]